MTRISIVFAFLLYQTVTAAQTGILPKKVAMSKLPVTIQFKGNVSEAWQWKDSLGENWLVLSTTDITYSNDEQTK